MTEPAVCVLITRLLCHAVPVAVRFVAGTDSKEVSPRWRPRSLRLSLHLDCAEELPWIDHDRSGVNGKVNRNAMAPAGQTYELKVVRWEDHSR